MSWNPCLDPQFPETECPQAGTLDSIETLTIPRAPGLGGFEVRPALPAPRRRMVAPRIFLDHAGRAEFATGQSVDVRPHPQVGLGTVTHLCRGDFIPLPDEAPNARLRKA